MIPAEQVYVQFSGVLRSFAIRRFGLTCDQADVVLQDVFISYLRNECFVENPKHWLTAAVATRCRNMQATLMKERERNAPLLPTSKMCVTLEKECLQRLTIREAFAKLGERCQKILTLHYVEGYSAREIATQLATTQRYAEKLLHNCLRAVRSQREDE